jgi:sulfur carrier protein ThiS
MKAAASQTAARSRTFLVRCFCHPVESVGAVIEELDYRRQTLAHLVRRYAPDHQVIVTLDGRPIEPDRWKRTRVRIGCRVDIVPAVGFFEGIWAVASWVWGTGVIQNLALAFAFSYLGGMIFGSDVQEAEAASNTRQSHSWDPQTTHQEGIPVPKGYGRNRHSGNIVAQWTDVNEDGDEVLYVIVCLGEGPTAGIVAGQVTIDDQPIGNFPGVEVQERRGTMDQTVMTGFEKHKLEYRPGTDIVHSNEPVTFTTPNDFLDDLEYTLEAPRGAYYYSKTGTRYSTPINVKVEISERGLDSWTTLATHDIGGESTAPIYKAFRVSDFGFTCQRGKRYDLRYTKITEDSDDGRRVNAARLRAVREVVDVAFRRPGKVLLGISALATSQLSGDLNNIKCLHDDCIVPVYDGTNWSYRFTRNRAWATLAAATQPVLTGNGDTVPYAVTRYEGTNPANVDLAFFYEWAQWCDDEVPDGKGGVEARMPCDEIVDAETDVWSLAHDLSETGRAHLYWAGNVLTGWLDRAVDTPVDLVTCDNIMAGSWKNAWTGSADMAGSVEVYYRDAAAGYERKPRKLSNELAGRYTRVVSVEGVGVTSYALATRVGNHLLQRNALIRNVNAFKMHKDAVRYSLGEVIRLQHRVPKWGSAYRVVRRYAVNAVTFDHPVSASAGDLLYLRTYDSSTEQVRTDPYTIASISGSTVVLETNLLVPPQPGDIAAVGSVQLRRIIKMVQTPDHYYEITVETYDPRLFESDDLDPELISANYVWPSTPASLDRPVTRQDVLDLVRSIATPQPDIEIPWMANLDWTGDGDDTVSWSARDSAAPIEFRYRGVTYAIAPGSTTDMFIYWDPDYTTVFRTTNLSSVALASGHWLMCVNKAGVAYPANAVQLLHAGVLMAGTIRAEQYAELRQTMAWSGEDSCDASHPYTFDFKLPTELTAVVSVKLSFRIRPFRSYSTGAASGGGQTSGLGGTGLYTTSGPANYPSTAETGGMSSAKNTGGTALNTDYTDLGSHSHTLPTHGHTLTPPSQTGSEDLGSHSHSGGSHTHGFSASTYTEYADGSGGSHHHSLSSATSQSSSANTGSTDLGDHAHALPSSSYWSINSVNAGPTNSTDLDEHRHSIASHVHSITDHTHTYLFGGGEHTHAIQIPNHTHTIDNHVHDLVFGIYEENNTVAVHFHVDNGAGFGVPSSSYSGDQTDIDITSLISAAGWKAVRFDVTARCRIVAVVEVKVDITA